LRYRTADSLPETAEVVPQSLEAISLDRYRPLGRLFNGEDLQFLSTRPGYRPEMAAAVRRSHRRVFRMYLSELSTDFHRLHSAARRLAVEAPETHEHLIGSLVTQQFQFWRIMAGIECQLALDWAGVGSADASRLLDVVKSLHQAVFTAPGALPVPA
jgi:hypothetical protein